MIDDVDAPAMATPGRETMACEKGEGMGNNATSFAVIVGGRGNGSIQAAQGQRRSITARGRGAQRAGPIELRRRAPPHGRGDDSDGIAIAENNAHRRRRDREDDRIGPRLDATKTTTTTTKGADGNDEEDPLQGRKYSRRAKARRRDQCLPRRYVARPSRLTTATRRSCSWRGRWSRPRPRRRHRWEQG
jgi:hypothetical protein